jgi:hypothetical protein
MELLTKIYNKNKMIKMKILYNLILFIFIQIAKTIFNNRIKRKQLKTMNNSNN